MFKLVLPETEFFNDATCSFVYIPPKTLRLEHSLVSVSRWESIHKKPFLNTKDKTRKEFLSYIQCCGIDNVSDPDLLRITDAQINEFLDYMNDSMTATTFSEKEGSAPSRAVITSELIYYWMIASQIPPEYEKWHLNRLLTLIKVCSIKNAPPKKMSKAQTLSRNAALNAARRQKHGLKG